MTVLLRLLYLLQTLPIAIPCCFLCATKAEFLNLLWGHKTKHISYQPLVLPEERGNWFSRPLLYYALHMFCILDWIKQVRKVMGRPGTSYITLPLQTSLAIFFTTIRLKRVNHSKISLFVQLCSQISPMCHTLNVLFSDFQTTCGLCSSRLPEMGVRFRHDLDSHAEGPGSLLCSLVLPVQQIPGGRV